MLNEPSTVAEGPFVRVPAEVVSIVSVVPDHEPPVYTRP